MSEETTGSHGKLSAQMVLAFVFGVIFVSVILYLSLHIKDLDAFTKMVFLVVLSLAAGGVGAVIPGFIVAGDPSKLVRAGGALAVFFIVLYFGSQYIAPGPTPDGVFKPDRDPSLVSNEFVSSIEAAKYSEAYNLTSAALKSGMSYYFFTENSKKILAKLGVEKSRSMIDQKVIESPPGMAPGMYCYTLYAVDFSRSSVKVYQNINLFGEKSANDWRVFGVWYSIKDSSGNFHPVDFNSLDSL